MGGGYLLIKELFRNLFHAFMICQVIHCALFFYSPPPPPPKKKKNTGRSAYLKWMRLGAVQMMCGGTDTVIVNSPEDGECWVLAVIMNSPEDGECWVLALAVIVISPQNGECWIQAVIVNSPKGGEYWVLAVIVNSPKGGEYWVLVVIVNSPEGGEYCILAKYVWGQLAQNLRIERGREGADVRFHCMTFFFLFFFSFNI